MLTVIISSEAFAFSAYAVSENENTAEEIDEAPKIFGCPNPMVCDGVERLVVEEKSDLVTLAAKYDPRDRGFLTDVKPQFDGTCWAFATFGCVEQLYSLKYGRKASFSEFHALNYLTRDLKEQNGLDIFKDYDGFYNLNYHDGGTFACAAQYLTNRNQPIISSNSVTWNSMVDIGEQPTVGMKNNSASSKINVTDIKYISNATDVMKHYIRNYGAVYCTMYLDNYVFETNNYESYCSNRGGEYNHAICIVGWDDNYSRNNFVDNEAIRCKRPEQNGAWLVRNSNCLENDGYFWMSYYECTLNFDSFPAVITGIEEADSNKYMMSYDFLPLEDRPEHSVEYDQNAYCANIYDTSTISEDYTEITEVMTYLRTDGASYNLYIVEAENIDDLPKSFDDYIPDASGTYAGEGYVTVKLKEPHKIKHGKKYAVIVECLPTDYENVTSLVSEVYKEEKGVPEINPNESFYCIDINSENPWKDKYYDNSTTGNFCIRPVFNKTVSDDFYADLSSDTIQDTENEAKINITTNSGLFCIKSNNKILRQSKDYFLDYSFLDNNTLSYELILSKDYLSTLGDKYTELILQFSNNIKKTVYINPKVMVTSVNISGVPLVNNNLTAHITTNIEKDNYDLNYQWQQSRDGISWHDISSAVNETYTVTDNDFQRYIRVEVSSSIESDNVVYPMVLYSDSTKEKVVIKGDANLDGMITIDDATTIQKYLANIITLDDEQLLASNTDKDADINIIDVTVLQKVLAGIISGFEE